MVDTIRTLQSAAERSGRTLTVERNAPVFFFAGLCSTLSDGQRTCAILTRAAETELADIHYRMPIILNTEQLPRWLAGQDEDAHVIESYGLGWTGKFLVRKVRPFGIKGDGPELIEPWRPNRETS